MNAVATFLARLSPPLGQFLEIRTIVPDGRARSTFAESVEKAVAAAERANGTANVYVGACPRFRRSGKSEDVSTVIAAWADLDFHQIDGDRDKAAAIAEARITSLGIVPTILVWTGNGLQAWWIFDEPSSITEQTPREWFEAINRGLAKDLGGDAVHDIARVLRVPGTLNLPDSKKRGRGCVPVMAQLENTDGPAHSPSDFVRYALRVSAATPQKRTLKPNAVPRADEELLRSFEDLLRELGSWHPLTRTWRGHRFPKDDSRSGWDMALVIQLKRARICEEFIPALVRAYPLGRGLFAKSDYIARTIEKARCWLEADDGVA